MDSSITAKCFIEREPGLIPDMAGNRLPVGSLIMYKLTPFVITKMVTLTAWEMDYQADDEYFEFLDQHVKELHMERSQGFITSVYRALMGSRCMTRKREVTGIPPTPVTMELHSPETQNEPSLDKTLEEDTTQGVFWDE